MNNQVGKADVDHTFYIELDLVENVSLEYVIEFVQKEIQDDSGLLVSKDNIMGLMSVSFDHEHNAVVFKVTGTAVINAGLN